MGVGFEWLDSELALRAERVDLFVIEECYSSG
jgi:hypothetical protein